ncbi:MAG: fatty acid desaturase [Myxococcota bacterium]
MRSGSELVRATFPFAVEDRRRTWQATGITLVLLAITESMALFGPWWLRLVGMTLTALLTVRMFIIYHDAMHGAVFKGSVWGQRLMSLVGILTLSPRSVWKETHDYHHRNNCKLPSTAIGSFPVVTTRHWRRMAPNERRYYAFIRHPFTILFGYFFLFLFGMCAASFYRAPKQHWASGVAPVVHFALAGLVGVTLGWGSALTGVIGVMFVACAVGGYLFYAQHNYPGVEFQKRTEWSYHDAALKSSSYFKMSPVMHFLTGNIGYHHVHHLNHNIPFYRLPEAMAALPELQSPGETSWKPADVWAALSLKLWDPTKNEMVPFPSAN